MLKWIAVFSGLAIVLLLGALFWLTQMRDGGEQFAQCRAGQIAGGAATIGGPFELVSGAGETLTEKEVIDQPVLIYFGYTFCPDICPFDVARNADAVDALEKRGYQVKPVFITIDPKRDTQEVVADYASNMHSRMLGLTGSPEQIRTASQAYRAYYQSHDNGTDDYYLVDHSTLTYLMMPGHGFAEFFRRDATAEQMADRVQCFLDAA